MDDRQLIALLETFSRVSSMHQVEASQVFELIEDPLMNLLVPIATDIIISLSKIPFIMLLCQLIPPFLMDLLAIPLGTSLWPGASPSLFPGAAGVEGMASSSSFGKSSSSSTTTTTTTTEEVVEEDVFLEFGGCDSAQSAEQCATARGTDDTHCAWCVKHHSGGVVSKCMPCSGSGMLSVYHQPAFKCPGFEELCKPKPKPTPESTPREEPKVDPPPTAPNEIAKSVSDQVNGATVEQLVHSLRTPIAKALRERLRGMVVRGVARALTKSLSQALTKYLTATLQGSMSDSLTVLSSKLLTGTVTPSVAATVSSAIVMALARNPSSDTYCRYCKEDKRFCSLCHVSEQQDQWLTAQAWHAGTQYGQFYGAAQSVNIS